MSRHYCGQNIGVRNRQKERNGIKVQVADGKNMDEVQEGKVPFNRLPEDAAAIKIFPNIPPILSWVVVK